jgi:ABC-type nitrate/sulfonate/bicarbonate transport system substrate-binding protein
MNWKWSGLALGAAIATAHEASAQVAKVGDKMSYTFNQPLLNGQGVKTLADLQGKPVVVEFWGTH